MGAFIEPTDLAPFADIAEAKAAAMIEDAEAQAILTAPCLATLDVAPEAETPEDQAQRLAKVAAAKAVLRAAILRWHDAGSGAVQSHTVGPFGQTLDTRIQRRALFWPTEVETLQGICAADDADDGKAFAVDTVGPGSVHLPWCALHFGATYCSCGVDIAGVPIFEGA